NGRTRPDLDRGMSRTDRRDVPRGTGHASASLGANGGTRIMKLLPIDSVELIELVAGWLGKYDNYKWLDFGNGVQQINPVTLRIMTQRDIHVFRIYTAGEEEEPAGVVGLTNVDRKFRTASLWAVLGNKRYGGYTMQASHRMLTVAFTEL